MTFSIVGIDEETSELGVAIATARPSVGGRCVYGTAGSFVIATQAIVSPALAFEVGDGLASGMDLEASFESALDLDPGRARRQLLAIDATGNAFAYTGADVAPWSGALVGSGVGCAGNLLRGPEVIERMTAEFEGADGSLAERLVLALKAGETAGGDRRGRESAALMVLGSERWPAIDIRVDSDPEPVDGLRVLLERWRDTWGHYERTGNFPPADPPGLPRED